jgi:two-component system, chemotaxis family, chemotaxis protein CheY
METTDYRPAEEGPILVVDDDQDLLESLGDVLEFEGFTVMLAHGGRQALEFLSARPLPSMVLLDLWMPEVNGWAFLERFRGSPTLTAIPVVIFTGDLSAQVDGVAATLIKPFDVEEVLQVIRRHRA